MVCPKFAVIMVVSSLHVWRIVFDISCTVSDISERLCENRGIFKDQSRPKMQVWPYWKQVASSSSKSEDIRHLNKRTIRMISKVALTDLRDLPV